MTSYQGRMKEPRRDNFSVAWVLVFILLITFASSFSRQLREKDAELATCQEFLSDVQSLSIAE